MLPVKFAVVFKSHVALFNAPLHTRFAAFPVTVSWMVPPAVPLAVRLSAKVWRVTAGASVVRFITIPLPTLSGMPAAHSTSL